MKKAIPITRLFLDIDAHSSPGGRGGSHNMEVERQTISLFYCRNCLTDGGKLLAALKRTPIQGT
jgi:hypothetical protein